SHAPRRRSGDAHHAGRARVGRALRVALQSDRGVHQSPAAEDRVGWGAAIAAHRARCGLRAARRAAMRRSIRLRLLPWILALLLPVSVAAGWLLVQVFADRLLRDIDVALEEEAETISALALNPSSDDALGALMTRVAAETNLGTPKHIVVSRGGRIIGE